VAAGGGLPAGSLGRRGQQTYIAAAGGKFQSLSRLHLMEVVFWMQVALWTVRFNKDT
jgi:hypothetical protein